MKVRHFSDTHEFQDKKIMNKKIGKAIKKQTIYRIHGEYAAFIINIKRAPHTSTITTVLQRHNDRIPALQQPYLVSTSTASQGHKDRI